MTSQVIAELFASRGGFVAEGARWNGPEGAEATVFAAVGNESLVIDRVKSVEIENEVVILATRKDIYAVACTDVRAIRFSSAGPSPGY